jgi:hypothetical protein
MVATALLVFYRFKAMSKEETQKANDEWNELRIACLLVLSL